MRLARPAVLLLLSSIFACGGGGGVEPDTERVGVARSGLDAVASFGANPAQLKMYAYVPKDMPAGPRPLVVALHGCSQSAAAYEATGWSTLADAWKFYVVYPEQNSQRNNSGGCFNWGGRWKSAPQSFVVTPEALDLTEIARGHGENESIKEMVDKMKADHPIDGKRVFVTGLSAGGAMTAVLLATWPDVFSAGAIFAGVPYGCATNKKDTTEAANCLKDYSGANAYLSRTPEEWGSLVRSAAPDYKGPMPRVSLWQGTTDYIVNQKNQAELVKQWTNANGVGQTPDGQTMVDGFPHAEYKDANGVVRVETYTITGQGHGTEVAPQKPIDPANASGGTCGKAGAYILSAGICSTYWAGKFFGLDKASADTPDGGSSGSSGPNGTSAGPNGSAGNSGGKGGGGDDGSSKGAGATCAYAPSAPSPAWIAALALGAALAFRRRATRAARP